MKIYVITGTTGEYSDRSEWLVTAYTKEDDAKKHVEEATKYAEAWHALTWEQRDGKNEKTANPMDPCFSHDYTGTEYYYTEVDLQKKFKAPEPLQ